jgi:hypothetical protein
LAALDCFIGLGALGIYLKFALLGPHWTAIARFYNESGPQHVPLTYRLSFLLQDVWLNFIAVPVLGTLALLPVGIRYRTTVAALVSAAVGIAYFVELQVHKQVGRYLGPEALEDLAGWTITNSANAMDYVTTPSLLKLVAFMGLVCMPVALDRFAKRSADVGRLDRALTCRRVLWFPVAAVAIIASATVPVLLSAPRVASPLATSAIVTAATTLTKAPDEIGNRGDIESPFARFRQLTRTAVFDPSSRYVGSERDSDVILFVMETGAAQALDIAAVGRSLPGIDSLYSRAFVPARHYTTHPYSSDALYSIFSGLYPGGRRRVLRAAPPGSLTGLMTSVPERAMIRRVYLPSVYQIELDDRMYEALGAEQVYTSDEHDVDALRGAAERRAEEFIAELERRGSTFDRRRTRLKTQLRADLQALEKTKRDIAEAIRANRRYVVMFFPEIGHGPWLSLGSEQTVLERGRALMLLQITWLNEILDVVRSLDRFDRTVVAITADHGVRTRAEDPSLRVGEISDYMFRVPFLLYAPQTLSATVTIDVPTSHIDIAPSVLALLGVTRAMEQMQGVPVWQRSAADRIYLLAFAYGGADGFVENGQCYMRQGISGATFVNDRCFFEAGTQVPSRETIARFVDDGLNRLDLIQQSIISRSIHNIRTCGASDCTGAAGSSRR